MAERRQRKASLISSAPIEPSTSNSGKPIEAYNSASPEDATSTSTGTGTGPNAGDGANGGTTTSQHKAPSSSSSTTNSTAAAGAQPLSARERKRALDRKAQRASREKTRARIAHLENLVKALSEQHNEAETVQQLLSEIERLTAESEKLRKIIKEIGGLVEEFGDSRAATEAGQSISSLSRHGYDDNGGGSTSGMRTASVAEGIGSLAQDLDLDLDDEEDHSWLGGITGNAEEADGIISAPSTAFSIHDPATQQRKRRISGAVVEEDGVGRWDMQPFTGNEMFPYTITSSQTQANASAGQMLGFAAPAAANTANSSIPMVKFPLPSSEPLDSSIPVMPPPPTPASCEPYSFWIKGNHIYAKILACSAASRVAAAAQASAGTVIRFVKHGWDGLSVTEKSNPLIQIMRDVNESLFWDMEPVVKIATFYKSQMLMKYYLDAIDSYLEDIPEWQRPIHSQRTKPHPLLIDFFPWPAFRDFLIYYHTLFAYDRELHEAYRTQVRFHWPYPLADAYTYDIVTGEYTISPLFKKYFWDMNNWGMSKRFFDKFPHFRGKSGIPEVPDDNDHETVKHRREDMHEEKRRRVSQARESPELPKKTASLHTRENTFENWADIEMLYFGHPTML